MSSLLPIILIWLYRCCYLTRSLLTLMLLQGWICWNSSKKNVTRYDQPFKSHVPNHILRLLSWFYRLVTETLHLFCISSRFDYSALIFDLSITLMNSERSYHCICNSYIRRARDMGYTFGIHSEWWAESFIENGRYQWEENFTQPPLSGRILALFWNQTCEEKEGACGTMETISIW